MSNYTNNLFTEGATNNSWSHLYDYIPTGSKVLDIGCSSGNFGEVLKNKKKCTVVGIDIDEGDIALAKSKINQAYIRNVETDDLTDLGMFDVIIFADVLEHLVNPAGALVTASKLLNEKGFILFSIPNMTHISIRLMIMQGYFGYTPTGILDKTHLHFYDEDEVIDIFNRANLRIDSFNPTIVSYTDNMVVESLKKMGLNPNKSFYNNLNKSNGFIFQFIGRASISTAKSNNQKQIRYTFPDDANKKEFERLERKISDDNKKIEQLEKQFNDLNNILNSINSSMSWRITKPLRLISKKIKDNK